MEKQNVEKQTPEVMEIDIFHLLGALWHRAWLIILATLIGGGLSFYQVSYKTTPTYTASALMYVNSGSLSVGGSSISMANLSLSQSLVQTYLVILKTRLTLNEVIKQADLNYSYEQLYGMVDGASVNDTEIFRVTVTSRDPEEAAKIANTITEVLPDKISEIMDGASVRTVDYAVVPTYKSSPDANRKTVVGMLVGFVVSCGLILLLELMDDQIRDEDYLLQTFDLPVLAVVPNLIENSARNSAKEYRSQHSPSSDRGQKKG